MINFKSCMFKEKPECKIWRKTFGQRLIGWINWRQNMFVHSRGEIWWVALPIWRWGLQGCGVQITKIEEHEIFFCLKEIKLVKKVYYGAIPDVIVSFRSWYYSKNRAKSEGKILSSYHQVIFLFFIWQYGDKALPFVPVSRAWCLDSLFYVTLSTYSLLTSSFSTCFLTYSIFILLALACF